MSGPLTASITSQLLSPSVQLDVGPAGAATEPVPTSKPVRPKRILRFNSKPDIIEFTNEEIDVREDSTDRNTRLVVEKLRLPARRSRIDDGNSLYRLAFCAFALAVLLSVLHGTPWSSPSASSMLGVKGGAVGTRSAGPILDVEPMLSKRQENSPTDICSRWAHMTAMVNGTLYIYGGEATTQAGQTSDTWNNNFLALDLTKSFTISDPPLAGLPQPAGPPAVSLGALWYSYDSLFVYGGEYSSDPPATPDPYSLWEYDIHTTSWIEHSDPRTSAGQYSSAADEPVQRAAEGSSVSIPSLGRAFYFGGHQDGYTTPGWSQSIWRIYLTSLLEFTFPVRSNTQVTSLSNDQRAPEQGVWRNITSGGTQDTAGFPERADGLLVYIPGYGEEGILLGLAGGTNTTFQQMSQLDVYDIATSTWHKQATTGPTPRIRVNPCAVVAAAADGSSHNLYMFAGQNLQPTGDQTQYDDMWILTIPSFTWIQVDMTDQPVPYPRAGHSCSVWNAQMVLVGGYVGTDISCDSPGVYVFDLSALEWTTSYSAGEGADAASRDANPLNQQIVQRQSTGGGAGGLEGSLGYAVPDVVLSVIGGGPQGGATVTQPAQLPSDGPMRTGRPVTYTVTATQTGSSVTETAQVSGQSDSSAGDGLNVAAIVAGVVAGLSGAVALYLAFCLWLYKKRLRQYKRHLEMASRLSWDETPFAAAGFYGEGEPGKHSDESSPFVSGGATGNGSGQQAGSVHGSGGSGRSFGDQRTHYYEDRRAGKSVDDLLSGGEPSFWGTALSPKRSLRVTNSD